jgi:hypothetical protein
MDTLWPEPDTYISVLYPLFWFAGSLFSLTLIRLPIAVTDHLSSTASHVPSDVFGTSGFGLFSVRNLRSVVC